MRYGRGDSFPFDFDSNGFPFGSKSKGKMSPRSYPIQFERSWKYSFLSVSQYLLNGTFFMKSTITEAKKRGKGNLVITLFI